MKRAIPSLMVTGGSFTPILSLYPSASAAYSLRQVSLTATNCIRVRRSSDSTEQDIGFSRNVLDQGALLSFVGAGNGFIAKWYDQSGNGRDAVQATTTNQPTIVSSGVVTTSNGKPSVSFVFGDNTGLMASFASIALTTHSAFAVFSASIGDSFGRVISMRNATQNDYEVYVPILSNDTVYTSFGAYVGASAYQAGRTVSTSALNLYSAIHDGTQINNSANGSSDATFVVALSESIIRYTLGASALVSDVITDGNITGYISEAICYPSDQTSNKTGILNNINNFYAIY